MLAHTPAMLGTVCQDHMFVARMDLLREENVQPRRVCRACNFYTHRKNVWGLLGIRVHMYVILDIQRQVLIAVEQMVHSQVVSAQPTRVPVARL